ncbi:MAG: cupin, partial [SAR324 cluster bacterium]|nr:cupin [SAR324 cluster bacterium]
GSSFVINSGDCVLQPPHIRHQVLECSDGLEVIEVSCPAEHETYTDHLLELPNSKTDPSRNFSGQRFLFFQGEQTAWEKHPPGGLFRDTGIGSATRGIAEVRVLRPDNNKSNNTRSQQGELLFYFVLKGSIELNLEEQGSSPFKEGDSASIPPGMNYSFGKVSENTEILEVHMPKPNSP